MEGVLRDGSGDPASAARSLRYHLSGINNTHLLTILITKWEPYFVINIIRRQEAFKRAWKSSFKQGSGVNSDQVPVSRNVSVGVGHRAIPC